MVTASRLLDISASYQYQLDRPPFEGPQVISRTHDNSAKRQNGTVATFPLELPNSIINWSVFSYKIYRNTFIQISVCLYSSSGSSESMLSYPQSVARRSLKQYRRESRRRELSMAKNILSGRSILLLPSREPFTFREPRGTILPVALPRSHPPRGSFPIS